MCYDGSIEGVRGGNGKMTDRMITDFYFSDAPMAAGQERHRHNVYQLLYVVEGSLCCEIAGSPITAHAPALVFIGNYEPHMITAASERYVRYVLTLDPYQVETRIHPELLQTVFSYHPAGFAHSMDISPIADEVRVMIEQLYHEWCLPPTDKLPEGEALLLAALLYRLRQFSSAHFADRRYGTAEIIVASVRRELECHFAAKLDLDALATQNHVSRYYLAHIFKKGTGYSLKEYLMLCRISYACQQLTDSDRPIGEIAELAGFADMSNFSRYFRAMIGMPPTEFRRRAGSGRS